MEDWRPISEAPRDGTVFLLQKPCDKMPCFYSAWYLAPSKKFDSEGIPEYEGHLWILNDDENHLIVDEEDCGCLFQNIKQEISIKQLVENHNFDIRTKEDKRKAFELSQ